MTFTYTYEDMGARSETESIEVEGSLDDYASCLVVGWKERRVGTVIEIVREHTPEKLER